VCLPNFAAALDSEAQTSENDRFKLSGSGIVVYAM
jgi:hypothetical protein